MTTSTTTAPVLTNGLHKSPPNSHPPSRSHTPRPQANSHPPSRPRTPHPMSRQPDPALSHACHVADDLVTQLDHLNSSLVHALERLRAENVQLHDREKCLDAEVLEERRRVGRYKSVLAGTGLLLLALFLALALASEIHETVLGKFDFLGRRLA